MEFRHPLAETVDAMECDLRRSMAVVVVVVAEELWPVNVEATKVGALE
jgi:hypothetical protein